MHFDLKLRESFNENGLFITTNCKVVVPEPTGEVVKYAKGDTSIASRLLPVKQENN
jgi:hypothetical protein